MKDLTIQQKAAAFDALVEWLMKAADEKKAEFEKPKREAESEFDRGAWCAMEQASAMAVVFIGQIASQLAAQPQQAENMPPAGLDLSKHVGQTAVLWDGRRGEIQPSGAVDDDAYQFRLCLEKRYLYLTSAGFYWEEMSADIWNIKTILPC